MSSSWLLLLAAANALGPSASVATASASAATSAASARRATATGSLAGRQGIPRPRHQLFRHHHHERPHHYRRGLHLAAPEEGHPYRRRPPPPQQWPHPLHLPHRRAQSSLRTRAGRPQMMPASYEGDEADTGAGAGSALHEKRRAAGGASSSFSPPPPQHSRARTTRAIRTRSTATKERPSAPARPDEEEEGKGEAGQEEAGQAGPDPERTRPALRREPIRVFSHGSGAGGEDTRAPHNKPPAKEAEEEELVGGEGRGRREHAAAPAPPPDLAPGPIENLMGTIPAPYYNYTNLTSLLVMDEEATRRVAESAAALQRELEAVAGQAIEAIQQSDLPNQLLGDARKVQEDMKRDVERATEEAVEKLKSLITLPVMESVSDAVATLEALDYSNGNGNSGAPKSFTAGALADSLWPSGTRGREGLMLRGTFTLLRAALSPLRLPAWAADDVGRPVTRLELLSAAVARARLSAPNRIGALVRRVQARLEGGWGRTFGNILGGLSGGGKGDYEADAEGIERSWAKRSSTSQVLRTLEIWGDAVYFLGRDKAISRMPEATEEEAEAKRAARKTLASQLRKTLLKLGPTFIKIGQLLSTRIDILPREYVEELSVLQDNCPRFSTAVAKQIVLEEFGRTVEEVYDTFDEVPLAAASLGQVHRATKDGKQLAVKIQRRGLRELFKADLSNLKLLASLLDRFDPKYDGADRNWGNIFQETERLLYQEIDYTLEAQNARRFEENFRRMNPELYRSIKVPGTYPELSSERVLTMEYVPGAKITDTERIREMGVDTRRLSRISAESYMTQLCRHGFFHCDPHPGNLAVDDVNGGRIIYYDFGMMDVIPEKVRKGLVDFVFGVYNVDARAVVQAMVGTGIIEPKADMYDIIKVVRYFVKEFDKTLAKPRDADSREGLWENEMSPEEQKNIKRTRRQRLAADFFSVNEDKPFKFPAAFTFVYRSFMSLDGIGKRLDSQYDMTRLAAPYLTELVDLKDGNRFKSFLNQGLKDVGLRPVDVKNFLRQPRNVAYNTDVLKRLEEGDLKLRTRALEVEKTAKKIELMLRVMGSALMAWGAFNAALLLTVMQSVAAASATAATAPVAGFLAGVLSGKVLSRVFFVAAAILAIQTIPTYRSIKKMDTVPAWW